MNSGYVRNGSHYLLLAEDIEQWGGRSFELDFLRSNDRLIKAADGRGSAWFINLDEHTAVLRHYYRGGMVAKVSRDRFVWNGVERSRAFAEYRLLKGMRAQALPVPEPLGARVIRSGLFYSCDLITRVIPNARTMADCLGDTPLKASIWAAVGRATRQLHDHGVWHADLNARNILIDDKGAVSLIDFDRCRRREGETWKADNLARLRRSLDKLRAQGMIQHFQESDWQLLLAGYHGQ